MRGMLHGRNKQRHLAGDAMSTLGLGGRGVGPEEMGEKGPLDGENCVSKGLERIAWPQGWESGGSAGAQQACKEPVGSELQGL